MTLPKQYAWLAKEGSPRLLAVALSLYGTAEKPGPANNPSILAWAKSTGLGKIYKADSTAWCGLFMAYAALQAGWEPPVNPLLARNWQSFGVKAETPMLGDVLVFWRGKNPSGYQGHVGLYVGEDATAYHVFGGNQADRVTIKRIAKSRLLQARRCRWKIAMPGNVRVVKLGASGSLSQNEA